MTAFLVTILAVMIFMWIGSAVFVLAIFLRPRLRARREARLRLRQKGKGI